jgi:Tfp pilus assembly protein PilV
VSTGERGLGEMGVLVARSPDNEGTLRQEPGTSRSDSGVTLIEIIIAIVLMGTVIVGTMSLLTTTIGATSTNRDHSNAHAWLQTASDMLYAREPIYCVGVDASNNPLTPAQIDAQRASIIAAYQATVQSTENPEDWPDGNIQVVDLLFWHYGRNVTTNGVDEGWYHDRCTTRLELIKLRVRNPAGDIIEEVEVIIGGE